MTTWRLALLYCAKHLLHFDEARQRRVSGGGVGERREREHPWPGRDAFLARKKKNLRESDAGEGRMAGDGKFFSE